MEIEKSTLVLSPYFEKLLNGNFKKPENEIYRVNCDTKSFQAILRYLRYNIEIKPKYQPAADYFMINNIQKSIKEVRLDIIENMLSIEKYIVDNYYRICKEVQSYHDCGVVIYDHYRLHPKRFGSITHPSLCACKDDNKICSFKKLYSNEFIYIDSLVDEINPIIKSYTDIRPDSVDYLDDEKCYTLTKQLENVLFQIYNITKKYPYMHT